MSTTQAAATERAEQLALLGFNTPRRIYRQLRREFPTAERLELNTAAGLGLTGITPLWGYHGALRPVICRKPPKGAMA